MSDPATLTLHLPQDLLDDLTSLAERTGRDVAELAGEALVAYLDLQQRQTAAIAEAVAAADAGGPWIPHTDIVRWLESWETPAELPPPL
jgi:predicted transcriptional regulator